MNFNVIASGSSGNCYCIENNGHFIFIDAGATLTSVKKGLENRKPDNEKGASLFITHEHTDHISGILPLISYFNPKIYTSKGTAYMLLDKGVSPDIIYTMDAKTIYDFMDFSVIPFKTSHDAAEPFGFKFKFSDKVVSIATDLGVITNDLLKKIEDSDVLTVESNYEDDLLKRNRKYPEYLKKRIRSKKGHLSNKDAFYLVGELSKCRLKRCFLGHVSENNNDYDILDKYAEACLNTHNVDASVLRQKTRFVFNI